MVQRVAIRRRLPSLAPLLLSLLQSSSSLRDGLPSVGAAITGQTSDRPLPEQALQDEDVWHLNGEAASAFASWMQVDAQVFLRASRMAEQASGLTVAAPPPVPVTAHTQAEQELDARPGDHADVLNRASFWWMMGVMVLMVVFGVLRNDAGQPAVTEHKDLEKESGFSAVRFAHLAYCVIALNVAMLIWGVSQEFMTTTTYGPAGTATGFPSILFMVFMNRLATILLSGLLARAQGQPVSTINYRATGLPAISNLLASWCQYESLLYVSFTLQVVVKSAKLLPVMLLSTLRGKRHSVLEYVEAAVISLALVVIGEQSSRGSHEYAGAGIGIFLLVAFLLLDSATPHLQDRAFQSDSDLTAVQLTFGMASVACTIAGLGLLLSGSFPLCVKFLIAHPDALLHLVVLSLSSAVTQFLISYTIRQFGPVMFTLIATTRQAISVFLSAVLFRHHITGLAMISCAAVFGTVVVRALRHRAFHPRPAAALVVVGGAAADTTGDPAVSRTTLSADPAYFSLTHRLAERLSNKWLLVLCAVTIHMTLAACGLLQEYLASHSFGGSPFQFPVFLIAVTRTVGAAFALLAMHLQGFSATDPQMKLTALPASTSFLAQVPQYEALFLVLFPVYIVVKSLKVLPVMFFGRFLKNRTYTWTDYGEALFLSVAVSIFAYHYEFQVLERQVPDLSAVTYQHLFVGGLVIAVWVTMEALTYNLEDYVYQHSTLDPSQQMFAIESLSSLLAWTAIGIFGGGSFVLQFIQLHPEVLPYIALLSIASSMGTFVCMLTVRFFGPAVLGLLLVSRQIVALILSVAAFHHTADVTTIVCLSAIFALILGASLRRVGAEVEGSVGGATAGALNKH